MLLLLMCFCWPHFYCCACALFARCFYPNQQIDLCKHTGVSWPVCSGFVRRHSSFFASKVPLTELSPPPSFSLAGCYGTLGLESGVVRSSQITGSSVWEWSDESGQPSVWQPSGARLKRPGLPWAAAHSDQHQWLQVDLKKKKRITGEKKEEQCFGVDTEEALNDVTPELTAFMCNKSFSNTRDLL